MNKAIELLIVWRDRLDQDSQTVRKNLEDYQASVNRCMESLDRIEHELADLEIAIATLHGANDGRS